MWTRIAFLLCCLAGWPGTESPALAQPAPIEVRDEAFIGAHQGVLRAGDDGIAFVANDAKHGRQWTFDEIRQLRLDKPGRIILETYQSRGWRGLGHSQTHEYWAASPVTPEWVAFVLSRTTRSVVTSVIPPRSVPAQFVIDVNHEGTDTRGKLAVYSDGLAFETSRVGFARFWRFTDLDTVLLQDRYRLFVAAYEGSRENVRPFLFTLIRDLPPGFYDQLWRQINMRSAALVDRPRP